MAAMKDALMSDCDIILKDQRIIRALMQDRIVLNIDIVADDYGGDIASNNRIKPNAWVLANRNVTGYDSIVSYIGWFM